MTEALDMNERSVIYCVMSKEHPTKQTIRTAARALFAANGYNAVSMREIANAVGKQPGGIYNHFPNKQSILVDLMVDNLDRAHAMVIAPIDGATPTARLEQFVRQHIAHNIANPDDIFIAYMELRSLEPEGTETIMTHRNAYERALRDIISDGAENGTFAVSDPAVHARAILSMLGGVTVWFRQTGPQSLEDVSETYVRAVLQSVGAPYSRP